MRDSPGSTRFCRDAGHAREDAAIRLRVPELEYRFVDRVQGEVRQHLGREVGDFVIQRRDGFYAYQLAVVLDDAWQGITDIVRGADLLDSTPRQLYLQELLGLSQPRYLHVPLIVQPDGHKLGKSYRSPPLPAEQAAAPLTRALRARPAAAGRTGPGQRQRGAGLGRGALGRHAHPALRYPSRGTPVARPAACRHPPAACSLPAQA